MREFVEKYINPFTDYGFKKISSMNKLGLVGSALESKLFKAANSGLLFGLFSLSVLSTSK